jgi:SsrA-binding protein
MKTIAANKKARHDYHIMEEYEAGLMLTGTEVKSLRDGRASLIGSFAKVINEELFLIGTHIPEYENGNIQNHEPLRDRKLLLHKKEVNKIIGSISQKGFVCVPLSVYFSSSGYAKVKLGIGKGKKLYDKREAIKKDMQKRDIDRDLRIKNK